MRVTGVTFFYKFPGNANRKHWHLPYKNNVMKSFNIFLFGALAGAVAGLLLAPESGADLRFRIKTLLKKKGYIKPDEIDILAERIACEIEK